MIFNSVIYSRGGGVSSAFSFVYTGDYTDNRDENGVGTVRLNTSGVLHVMGEETKTVSVAIVAGGGGACGTYGFMYQGGTGGGGGNQIVSVDLVAGYYPITIGAGGAEAISVSNTSAGSGGNTTAFGYTCTGGTGGYEGTNSGNDYRAGTGGSPNGKNGTTWSGSGITMSGGLPNGGGVVNQVPQPGGNGYVELTFS